MASLPSRSEGLERVLDSLTGQVDKMHVALNGYSNIPKYFLKYNNLDFIMADNSKGDAMKFYWANETIGYYVGWDDDLICANGTIEKLLKKCIQYNCPVSLHGKKFKYPVSSYHRAPVENYHCRKKVEGDHPVDAIGTGVCCFQVGRPVLTIADFPEPNMADLWFALAAKRQNIPLMVKIGRAHV